MIKRQLTVFDGRIIKKQTMLLEYQEFINLPHIERERERERELVVGPDPRALGHASL